MANPFVVGVISLVLGVLMVVNVLVPIVKGANTDELSAAELAVYGLITLGAIIGLGYSAFAIFGLA
jgi:hypothetical protein